MKYVHEYSLGKGIFDTLIQKYNVYGITIIPINPSLNFLSTLNYQLNNGGDYIIYLFILRLMELAVFFLYLNYFLKNIKKTLYGTLIFLLFIFQFNIFDHQSYVNLPIIIFNLAVILTLYFKENKFYFFTIFFIGNLWSFLINPIYFFTICFGPYLFLIIYLLYKKEYKNFLYLFLINLPFTLTFISISLGTSRIITGNLIKNDIGKYYNFNIFHSDLFLIIIFLVIGISTYTIYKKKKIPNIEILIFYLFIFISIIIGSLINLDLINWTLPHPIYIDYSLQYFYLTIIALIILTQLNKNIKNIILFLLGILILFKFYSLKDNIFNYNKIVSTEKKYSNTNLVQRHFWQKNQKIFLKKNYEGKNFLIDLPNKNSEWTKYLGVNSYDSMIFFNNEFNHSLTWNEFFNSNIRVNIGHSLLLGINNFYALNPKLEKLPKNTISRNGLKNNINDLANFDYILSDRDLKYDLVETIEYKNFNLFIFKYPSRKNYLIESYENPKNYFLDINNFDKIIYSKNFFKNKKKINKVCRWSYLNTKDYNLKIKIQTNDSECLMIFPIAYSKTNNFVNKQKIIETFRVQHFFHGAILKNNDIILISKKSLLKYGFSSILDFLEIKKFYNEKKS